MGGVGRALTRRALRAAPPATSATTVCAPDADPGCRNAGFIWVNVAREADDQVPGLSPVRLGARPVERRSGRGSGRRGSRPHKQGLHGSGTGAAGADRR